MAKQYLAAIEKAVSKAGTTYYRASNIDIANVIRETGSVDVRLEIGHLQNQSEVLQIRASANAKNKMKVEPFQNKSGYKTVSVPLWKSSFKEGVFNSMAFSLMDLQDALGSKVNLSVFVNTNKKSDKSPDYNIYFSLPNQKASQSQASDAPMSDDDLPI